MSTLLIRPDRVFDGTRVLAASVLVRDGVIVEVGPDLAAPGATVVDAPGQTLLPGLVDAHTHVFPGRLEQALVFGVTTELDMFADPAGVADLRRETTERAALRSAGTGATAPGGHPCQLVDRGLVPPFPTITDPDEAAGFVADRVAEGSDYLKIFLEPGTSAGRTRPAPDAATVRALVAAGHAAGLLVVAHATDAGAARELVDAGVDGLVHVWVDASSPELVAAIAAADVFVVPTLTVIDGLWGTGEGARALAREDAVVPYLDDVSRGGLAMGGVGLGSDGPAQAGAAVVALHAAGVAILAGTDAANPGTAHGASMHQELRLLVGAGLTPCEALRAATAEPAARFRLADRGRIAPGLLADLVLVAGDPTRDITATVAITAVWRRGVRLERETYAAALLPAPAPVELGKLDPLAATARWIAAERARESARPDALFTDPLADALAGEPGRALAERMGGGGDNPTFAVRTRFFDDAITAAVDRTANGASPAANADRADAHPPDAHPADAHPPDAHPADAHTTTSQASDANATGAHPVDLDPADVHPADIHPADIHPADIHPADTHQAGTRPSDIHPADDAQAGDHPTTAMTSAAATDPERAPRVDQVVVLAAGMDARAFRLDLPADLAWYELDRPALLAVKERELAGVSPRCARHTIGCDLTDDWPAALLGAGFDPARPTMWLVEGLLAYLEADAVDRLFDRLTALSAPGSHLLCDPIGESLLVSPWMRPALARLAEAGTPWRFGTDRPEDLLVPRGWRPTVALMADVATKLGRWPFPRMPRGTPGVPQSFLVHAVR